MDGFVKYQEIERVCEVCGSDNLKLIWEKKPWTKARLIKQDSKTFHTNDVICMECGLIFKNPMLTRDSQKEFYNGHYINLYKAGMVDGIPRQALVEGTIKAVYMLDYLKKSGIDCTNRKILEIGTGMGILLKGLESLGALVNGIDIDRRSCEIAKKLFAFTIANMNLLDVTPKEQYDIVISCNTIEHFYSPVEALNFMKSLIKDDGIIIIETPSYRYPYPCTLADAFLSSAHNFTFSSDSFKLLATKCGLSVANIEFSGHHSCMQIILNKSMNCGSVMVKPDYEKILARLDAHDREAAQINKVLKELLQTSNVNTIINEICSNFPFTSNHAFLIMAPNLIQAGRNQDVIVLMDQYKKGQSEHIDLCYASFLHYKGLAYRQMGDFLMAKKCFQDAKDNYPRFENYNFIKDLMVDGILSDTSFASYTWWNNQKCLNDIL